MNLKEKNLREYCQTHNKSKEITIKWLSILLNKHEDDILL